MLDTVVAVGYLGAVGTGKTRPSRLECECSDGSVIEVVAKYSSGMFEKEKNLAIEAIASMLAADLGLPVPEPFVIDTPPEFIELLHAWPETQDQMLKSCRYAFGTRHLPSGFAVWGKNQRVPKALCQQAAEVFTFDGIIVNSDRRPTNPNCLFSGAEFAIIDHELSLAREQVLFWKEPWFDGGFDTYATPDVHIFSKPHLESCPDELDRFASAWKDLDVARFNLYFRALPQEWSQSKIFEDQITSYLSEVRSNIDAVIQKSLEVLQ